MEPKNNSTSCLPSLVFIWFVAVAFQNEEDVWQRDGFLAIFIRRSVFTPMGGSGHPYLFVYWLTILHYNTQGKVQHA